MGSVNHFSRSPSNRLIEAMPDFRSIRVNQAVHKGTDNVSMFFYALIELHTLVLTKRNGRTRRDGSLFVLSSIGFKRYISSRES